MLLDTSMLCWVFQPFGDKQQKVGVNNAADRENCPKHVIMGKIEKIQQILFSLLPAVESGANHECPGQWTPPIM